MDFATSFEIFHVCLYLVFIPKLYWKYRYDLNGQKKNIQGWIQDSAGVVTYYSVKFYYKLYQNEEN